MSSRSSRVAMRSARAPYCFQTPVPVDAVHRRVVEEVALQAPRLAQHLLPLLARVDLERPARKIDLRVVRLAGLGFGQARRAGLDSREPFLRLEDEDLAVARDVVADDAGRQGRELLLLQVVRLQRSAALTVGAVVGRLHPAVLEGNPVEPAGARRERVIVSGSHGNLHEAVGDPVEVDSDRRDLVGSFSASVFDLSLSLSFASAAFFSSFLSFFGSSFFSSFFSSFGSLSPRAANGSTVSACSATTTGSVAWLHDEAGLPAVEVGIDEPVGEEIEKLALRVPGGGRGVHHRVGDRVHRLRLAVPDADLGELVRQRGRVGEVPAVGRPRVLRRLPVRRVDGRRRAGRDVGHRRGAASCRTRRASCRPERRRG